MATERNPENTRTRILQAAFDEIYQHGFQGARIGVILEKTGLKKGALYHHFSGKLALGYAVLEERVQEFLRKMWIEPLQDSNDPITCIKQALDRAGQEVSPEFIRHGCPLNNLAQEMSPIDEGFRERIAGFFEEWKRVFSDALKRGQELGNVKTDIDPDQAAGFIIAAIEGCVGQAKVANDKEQLMNCGSELVRYLDTLASD